MINCKPEMAYMSIIVLTLLLLNCVNVDRQSWNAYTELIIDAVSCNFCKGGHFIIVIKLIQAPKIVDTMQLSHRISLSHTELVKHKYN